MKSLYRLAAALTVMALVLGACGRQETTDSTAAPAGARTAGDWQTYSKQLLDEHYRNNPQAAVYAGLHEYDGKVADYRMEGLQAEITRLRTEIERAMAFSDSELSERQRLERDYAVTDMRGRLFWLVDAEYPVRNPLFYIGAIDPGVYLTREYAPLAQRLAAYNEYMGHVPAILEAMRQNLRPPLARPHAETATAVLDGFAQYLRNTVPGLFAGIEDEALLSAFDAANAAALESIEISLDWLGRQELNDDFALGEASFLKMLADSEGVHIDLATLKAAGEADLARNLDALASACAEIVPGEPLRRCIDVVKSQKSDGGAVAGARRHLPQLKAFLLEQGLVTIPGDEEALVAEAPPHKRFNFAYIEIPGAFETGLPSTYYIAPPDPAWPEEARLAYIPGEFDLLFTSSHEVWPGHFLQFLHSNRTDSAIGRAFNTYSYTEGWAHYVEEMMLEAGLNDATPETQVGQLLQALLRNVRYVSAVGMHTGGMTVAESQQLFLDKAFQDFGNASQQANRGTRDPAYLNYTLGKLMIMKLREDWTATRGGRDAWKAFHDEFLSYGSPPIPLVRDAMLGPDYAGDRSLLPVAR